MDVNDLRILVTLLSFAAFVGIVAWVWSRRNRKRFDEAQMLPFLDEPPAAVPSAPVPSAPVPAAPSPTTPPPHRSIGHE